MGFRRSDSAATASQAWQEFLEGNEHQVSRAGLPATVVASIDHWDDFLLHGRLAHHTDPIGFAVEALSPEQYAALVTLVDSYFARGYEYFDPGALLPEDRARLQARHAR
jgi:hypothetical protein